MHEMQIEYSHGGVLFQGQLLYDPESGHPGPRPLVVIYHQWMGQGDYEINRARMLAGEGFIAFAADMYGKGVRASDVQQASDLSSALRADRPLLRERAQAAIDALKSHAMVDRGRIFAIGYCFGGCVALELARSGYDLRGVASFHGLLDTPMPAPKGGVKAKVLALHGAVDPLAPQDQAMAFWNEMGAAGANWEFVAYGGTAHSFTQAAMGTDVSSGFAFNAQSDARSWARLMQFLRE
ncbi:MAG: hypothetical protein GMKNLPBB_01162 [Myxococcota bacterium]|nr:hypothetical protein [Myxococcota bacterium]